MSNAFQINSIGLYPYNQTNQAIPAEHQKERPLVYANNLDEQTSYSWLRRMIYHGSDYVAKPLSMKRVYQASTVLAAIAIQSFFSGGVTKVLNQEVRFDPSLNNIANIMLLSGKQMGMNAVIGLASLAVLNFFKINDGEDREKLIRFIKNQSFTNKLKLNLDASLSEEFYFRFVIQGTLSSIFKAYGISVISAAIFSSTLFGLARARQSLTQAIVTGASSYIFYANIYQKEGLLTSVALHFMNNLIPFLIMSYSTTTVKKSNIEKEA
jgi:hypothetical protein